MRTRSIAGLMLFGSLVWTLPAAASDPVSTVDAFHAALRAGKAEVALSLLAPDVQMYEQGYVETSRDHYAAGHVSADIVFAKETSLTVTERHVLWFGDAAACVLSQTVTRGQFQGQPVDLVGTETAVLRKAGDGWIISHIHNSAHPQAQDATP